MGNTSVSKASTDSSKVEKISSEILEFMAVSTLELDPRSRSCGELWFQQNADLLFIDTRGRNRRAEQAKGYNPTRLSTRPGQTGYCQVQGKGWSDFPKR
jgi:hypothetical protein